MIVVFVGDSDSLIARTAKEFDSSAYLLKASNYEEFLELSTTADVTVYTAHSDLPKITNDCAPLYNVLLKADKVFYCPPANDSWSDDIGRFQLNSQKYLTEFFLYLVQREKGNVCNFDINQLSATEYLSLIEERSTNDPTLWVAGCSVMHGACVKQSEKLSALVATELGLPLVSLTKPGSALMWAADQIIRSDIRKEDIVIWGLTEEHRPLFYNRVCSPADKSQAFFSEDQLYQSVLCVNWVVQYCKAVGAKLIMIPNSGVTERLRLLLSNYDDYYEMPYRTKYVDYGADNVHPGPKQHKQYANFCLDILKNHKEKQ